VRPGEVFAYPSGCPQRYEALDKPFEFAWLSFDGFSAEATRLAFGLAPKPRQAGPWPSDLFDEMIQFLQDGALVAERQASLTAYAILLTAVTAPSVEHMGTDGLVDQSVQLVRDGYTNPQMGVEQVAQSLHVHRITLCKHFKRVVGVSPASYLRSRRVRKALSLLVNTNLPVGEVARQSGFSSLSYFSQVIRQTTGVSPRGYRRSD